MKRYGIVAIAALAAATLIFAACGGDDDSKTTATNTATTAATTKRGDSGDAGANATKAPSPAASATSGGGSISGSGADALKALAKDLNNKTYQVTYDLEIKGTDGSVNKGTLTLANKPPKNSYAYKLDPSSSGNGPSDFQIINDGTSSFACTATGGTGQCVKSKASAGSLFANPFNVEQILKELDTSLTVTQDKDQTIAGQDSRCFVTKNQDSTQGTACFSKKDGILMLAIGGDDKSGVTVRATKYSTNVDDSLFAPPAGYNVTGQ
ncbi:MAG: hypothetical protein HYX53_02455 [Chloroflexi bacterium]|nr:hypothetical protein [Chloroflexota bacterium]